MEIINHLNLDKYPGLNLIINLGDLGSRFINSEVDVLMPPINEFNPMILSGNPVVDKS